MNTQSFIKIAFFSFCFFTSHFIFGQADSTWYQKPSVQISGFLDVFYVHDFNKPSQSKRQSFLYNHNRHQEFNLNLGYIKLGLTNTKYRANLALHAGTYANDNYTAEAGTLKQLYEANVGLALNKKNTLWLDAGVFPSHIGFESAVSMQNWTLTRSLLAENSPYFLSGAKLTYTPNTKWELAALMINGWQRIQRLEGSSVPSVGTQINFKPNGKIVLNWSTYLGSDDPDATRRMRYFNNFFGQFQLSEKLGLIAGFDIGFQQKQKESSEYNRWYSPVLIGQYQLNYQWKAAVRIENYRDEFGVLIPVNTANGFQTTGLSLNFDYAPAPDVVCRLEGRWLNSKDPIFERNSSLSQSNMIIATSVAVRFSERVGVRN